MLLDCCNYRQQLFKKKYSNVIFSICTSPTIKTLEFKCWFIVFNKHICGSCNKKYIFDTDGKKNTRTRLQKSSQLALASNYSKK